MADYTSFLAGLGGGFIVIIAFMYFIEICICIVRIYTYNTNTNFDRASAVSWRDINPTLDNYVGPTS